MASRSLVAQAAPSPRHYLDAVRRRLRVALWTATIVTVAAVPFVFGLPNLYKASSTVLVQGQLPDALLSPAIAGDTDARLTAIKQEALSRDRLTDLVQRFNLYPDVRRHEPIDAALQRLEHDMSLEIIDSDDSTGRAHTVSFRLSYVGRDPQTAASVANTLASFYVAENGHMQTEEATLSTNLLQDQLGAMKKKLDSQQTRLRTYTMDNIGSLPDQVTTNVAALDRLNDELHLNTETQMGLTARKQALQTSLLELDRAASPTDVDPQSRLVHLQSQLADLRTQWTDEAPDVQRLKAEIATLQQQIASGTAVGQSDAEGTSQRTMLQNAIAQIDAQVKTLNERSDALRAQIATYEQRVETAPGRQPEFDAVMRDYTATRDQYDALQKRFDEAQLAQRIEAGKGGEEFKILDPAVPPSGPAGPNRLRLLACVLLLAAALAFGAAVAVDKLDTSFHTVDELRQFTSVPVLTSIPLIVTHRDSVRRLGRSTAALLASAAALCVVAMGAFHLAAGNDQIARLLLRLG